MRTADGSLTHLALTKELRAVYRRARAVRRAQTVLRDAHDAGRISLATFVELADEWHRRHVAVHGAHRAEAVRQGMPPNHLWLLPLPYSCG